MAIQKVAVIGVGLMGGGAARNIMKGGYEVAVFDTDANAVRTLEGAGARAAASAADASDGADVVLTVLPEMAHLEAAVFGAGGVAETAGEGTVLVQQSTIDPATVIDLARRLEPQGVAVLDAPMLRGPAAAEDGTLGFVVGGDAAALNKARPVLDCMADSVEHIGPVGTGSALKLVNNMLNVTILCAAMEATVLGVKSGLTLEQMVTAFAKTPAWARHLSGISQVFEDRDFSPGFMTALGHKDIRLAMQHATSLQVPLSVAHSAYELMARAESQGYARDSYVSVLKVIEEPAGVTVQYEGKQPEGLPEWSI